MACSRRSGSRMFVWNRVEQRTSGPEPTCPGRCLSSDSRELHRAVCIERIMVVTYCVLNWMHTMYMRRKARGVRAPSGRERGAAAVEFALVLPLLLVLLLGIIDFGLYFYNDLQLTHVARDAARYLSVGETGAATTAIGNAHLVSTSAPTPVITGGAAREIRDHHPDSQLQLSHSSAGFGGDRIDTRDKRVGCDAP